MAVGEAADVHLPVSRSLMQLQNAADRIFDTIINRVGSQRAQLKGLSDRITSAQAKVDAMAGTRRATTIYSSAKYPQADPSVVDFVPLFEDAETGGDQGRARADTVTLDTGQLQSQEEGTLELFQFFSETSKEFWQKGHENKAGVGRVPPRVKSVADVLLFNSSELPYHNYKVVDNLAGMEPTGDQDEEKVRPLNLPPAPQSILAGDSAPKTGAEEFAFKPLLRPVPSFSLPSVLPNLPMVAEISWSGVTSSADRPPSIAPSAVHGGSVYSASPRFDFHSGSARFDPASLLTRSDSASESARTVTRRSDSGFSDADSTESERMMTPPRTLPPLHLPSTSQNRVAHSRVATSGSAKSSSGSSSSSSNPPPSSSLPMQSAARAHAQPPLPPPPPPPPLPPLAPPLLASPARPNQAARPNQGASTSAAQQPLPHIDTQRAALMASIRSSGLDLLRKTGRKESQRHIPDAMASPATVKSDIKVPADLSTPEAKQQPLNVMAEMAKSLTLRRLSMRGAASSQTRTPSRSDLHSTEGGGPSIDIEESSKPALPNLHADLDEEDEEQSDDDDDDDEWD